MTDDLVRQVSVIHKGAKAARPPHVRRRGHGLKDVFGIMQRLLRDGEELIMTHDTKTQRTSSLLDAVSADVEMARELARISWGDSEAAFLSRSFFAPWAAGGRAGLLPERGSLASSLLPSCLARFPPPFAQGHSGSCCRSQAGPHLQPGFSAQPARNVETPQILRALCVAVGAAGVHIGPAIEFVPRMDDKHAHGTAAPCVRRRLYTAERPPPLNGPPRMQAVAFDGCFFRHHGKWHAAPMAAGGGDCRSRQQSHPFVYFRGDSPAQTYGYGTWPTGRCAWP